MILQFLNDIVIFKDIYHSKFPPLCHALVPIRLDGPFYKIQVCLVQKKIPHLFLEREHVYGLSQTGYEKGMLWKDKSE